MEFLFGVEYVCVCIYVYVYVCVCICTHIMYTHYRHTQWNVYVCVHTYTVEYYSPMKKKTKKKPRLIDTEKRLMVAREREVWECKRLKGTKSHEHETSKS